MAKEGKEKIIEAARVVISRSGINGATIRSIAEEAGVSTGAIYHYYSSKEEVLYDVMDRSLSMSSQISSKLKNNKVRKKEVIDEIYENVIERFKKKDENSIQFYLAKEAMLGDEKLKEKFRIKYDQWISETEELMIKLYENYPTKYRRAIASLLIGAIDGVVMQLLLNANAANIEDIEKVYYELLKEGIPKFLNYFNTLEEKDIIENTEIKSSRVQN